MTWKAASFEVEISNENIDTFVKFDNTEDILSHLPNDLFMFRITHAERGYFLHTTNLSCAHWEKLIIHNIQDFWASTFFSILTAKVYESETFWNMVWPFCCFVGWFSLVKAKLFLTFPLLAVNRLTDALLCYYLEWVRSAETHFPCKKVKWLAVLYGRSKARCNTRDTQVLWGPPPNP